MRGTSEPDLAEVEVPADSRQVARAVIHRCNNFLALLLAHGETALASKDAAAMEATLRAILDESTGVEEFLRRCRRRLGE